MMPFRLFVMECIDKTWEHEFIELSLPTHEDEACPLSDLDLQRLGLELWKEVVQWATGTKCSAHIPPIKTGAWVFTQGEPTATRCLALFRADAPVPRHLHDSKTLAAQPVRGNNGM
eukprot:4055325-Amphidinium_carterae.1